MRQGVRLAVDVGSVRVGVATCDPAAMLATPLRTLVRDDAHDEDVAEVAREAAGRGAVEVLVGLPLSMDGSEGPAAHRALDYAGRLARAVAPVPVRMVDERLSTVDAHRVLHAAGRRERSFRAVVDQVAAVVLLQAALDVERSTGRAPGRVVGTGNRKPRTARRQAGADTTPAATSASTSASTSGTAPGTTPARTDAEGGRDA
ncbi:Holliday junction resolvase RuvX [Kineococcus sp. R8]|nr:Holliday junction resolvase RuvX [Kineococcus siccus]